MQATIYDATATIVFKSGKEPLTKVVNVYVTGYSEEDAIARSSTPEGIELHLWAFRRSKTEYKKLIVSSVKSIVIKRKVSNTTHPI